MINIPNHQRQLIREEVSKPIFSKHHIGGRSGYGGFPSINKLNKSIAYTVYDADEACCAQIEQVLKNMGFDKIQVIAKCIEQSEGFMNFNLNYDPYTSSVLAIDKRYENHYIDCGAYDYSYSSAMKIVKTTKMPVVSLDKLDKHYPVDFLSLDTQGNELSILKGASNTLETVLGIETEISFREVYKGSALFGEMCDYLDSQGFEFICFTSILSDAPMTMPYSGRAKKLNTFGDALFLRKPTLVHDEINRKKLIFVALAYGQVELAVYFANQFQFTTPEQYELKVQPENINAIESWIDFVEVFLHIVSEFKPNEMPPIFSDSLSLESSYARFDLSSEKPKSPRVGLFSFIRSRLALLPEPLKNFLRDAIRINEVFEYHLSAPTKLEMLFEYVELHSIVKKLKRSRFRNLFPLTDAFSFYK
jgi:FkbM family methyltransferase